MICIKKATAWGGVELFGAGLSFFVGATADGGFILWSEERTAVGWGLAPTLSVIGMLGVFGWLAGESLVVLSFCVQDERREQAPALHY